VALSLYLDECVPPALETHLRTFDPYQRYINYIEHASRNARGASDAHQLKIAAKYHVLVTVNISDFLWLHRQWKTLHAWNVLQETHKGILAASATLPIDALGVAIYNFLKQDPLPMLENNMYIYKGGSWQPHPW
jgi:hypothetical protein